MSLADLKALGLGRSATHHDVKKACRERALACHPDRNPSGAELFKRIAAAHEALAAKFRQFELKKTHANVGSVTFAEVDPMAAEIVYSSMPRPPSFKNGASSSSRPAATPLFTDEELFGDLGGLGGFDSFREASSHSASQRSSSFRRRFDEASAAAASTADDQTSAGGRRPARAYEPSAAMEAEARRFAERERRAESVRRSMAGVHVPETVDSSPERSAEGTPLRGAPSPVARDTPPSREHQSPPRGAPPGSGTTRAAMDAEWRATRERMQRDEHEAKEAVERDAESRRERIAAETAAEWRRTQLELERKQRDLDAVEAAREATERVAQDRAAQLRLHEVQAQRRVARREAFNQLVPSDAALGRLTDMELDILTSVLSDGVQRAIVEADRRRTERSCEICGERPRVASLPAAEYLFECYHQSTCRVCAGETRVAGCPVCGARAR
jgi:curved DNA-binding protein CbpA